ncbi:Molybdopterin converting factor, small subunit [Roseovarius azorensis]|uniref:Molybdopterin converting factor, small subunit n=1 Tax=Roseovarius azorensis TaxID=1287727 RepID=A0A1H7LCU3_9RHOB|nr:MoaD/ThiS family protein [Roseovarius azorensis]SEK96620.1 Molybdopterin converting factor, small subunit [Roseovarius azorensis]
MVRVRLWGSLAEGAEGQREVEIEAGNLRELLDGLGERFPALRAELERGVSVSIDGRVYNDSWFTPIGPESEVVLLRRLKGG